MKPSGILGFRMIVNMRFSAMMKKNRREVALLANPGWGDQAILIDGVMKYARQVGNWHIIPTPETNISPGYLAGWNGDPQVARLGYLSAFAMADR